MQRKLKIKQFKPCNFCAAKSKVGIKEPISLLRLDVVGAFLVPVVLFGAPVVQTIADE